MREGKLAGTAITYSRVSAEERAKKGYSLPDQRDGMRRWCEEEGYEILHEIADEGWSGAYLERPGLDKVRDLVAAGGVDVVVVMYRDRLARGIYAGLLADEFKDHGTRLVALNVQVDDSPEGELQGGLLDLFSAYERSVFRRRTLRGLNRKVAEGKLIRGNKAPYGFAYDQSGEALLISEPEMGTVRSIFRMVGAEGLSLGEVERRLNDQGIPSPNGGKWCRQSIRYLVLSELYRPLSAGEVAASGLVTPEVVRALDEDGVYGLWTWNRKRVKRWRERAVDGGYRSRVENEERPREAWTAVPVSLADAGLVREPVEAARERLAENKPRQPANQQRFWQLTGKITWCGVCGNGFSTHTVHESGKIRCYYRCYTRYQYGLDACTNSCHMRAEELEELVWGAVLDILSDPGRLKRQWQEHVERQRRQMRGDPDKEALRLAKRLAELDLERKGYQRLAARGSMSDDELDAALAELEGQRRELAEELEQARNRQQTIQEQERQLQIYTQMVEHFDYVTYAAASDADRHRLYKALRLQVSVDEDRTIRLSGIFDPDVYLPGLVQDFPRDLSEPLPKLPADTRVVVSLTSATPCTS